MRKLLRRILWFGIGMLLICCMSGCRFSSEVEDLMTLPQLPMEYTGLSKELEGLLNEGYEYAAPTNGRNIQSVQMVDLDADGEEEAVAFFRKNGDEKPLKIIIFRPDEDTYVKLCTIESSGTAVESVSYCDLTGNGKKELVVGWKVSADVQTVAAYNVAPEPTALMQSSYTRFAVEQLETDTENAMDLVVFRAGDQGSVAELYRWENDSMSVTSKCKLSFTMAELNRGSIVAGGLSDGSQALYVTGVNEQAVAVTDILTCRSGTLSRVAENDATGLSSVVYRDCQMGPLDIDEDGVVEIPIPMENDAQSQGDGLISWQRYDADGQASWALDTYHCLSAGWYFRLDDSWHGRISATSGDSGTVEYQVILCLDERPIAAIYTISGESRETRGQQGNRFVLNEQAATVYAGEVLAGGEAYGLEESYLRQSFHLIVGSWASQSE